MERGSRLWKAVRCTSRWIVIICPPPPFFLCPVSLKAPNACLPFVHSALCKRSKGSLIQGVICQLQWMRQAIMEPVPVTSWWDVLYSSMEHIWKATSKLAVQHQWCRNDGISKICATKWYPRQQKVKQLWGHYSNVKQVVSSDVAIKPSIEHEDEF